MAEKLSSLLVTANMDASGYARGAAEKTAADKKIIDSSRAVGAALAAQDAAAEKLAPGVQKLSRAYIDGYSPAEKFSNAIKALNSSLTQGMPAERAALTYGGVVAKFGQMASATDLTQRAMVSLAPVVAQVNQRLEAQAEIARRAADASQRLATAQQAQAAINQRLGVSPAPSGSARASAEAFLADFGGLEGVARSRASETAQAFTADLNSRLVAGIRSSARESASVFEAEFARLDTIAKAKAEQIASTTQIGIAQAYGIGRQGKSASASASVFQDQFAEQDAMARSAASLRQQLLPLQAEQERSKTNLIEIDKLEKARVISMQEAVQMRGAEALRTEQAQKSIQGMYIAQGKYTTGVGLARNELVNLSRQLQDVVVTLQAGQPLSTILFQQGTQIADIFMSSRASMSGFFAQAARGVAGFATSLTGIATGVLAVGAAGVYVGTAYGNAQREVERTLGGIGAASGATVASINAVAAAVASQQRISTAAAREIASVYAGTGRISGGNIGALTGITRDFAAQTGASDAKAAAEELSKAFSGDVVKGAESLNEKLGFLTNRTREYIRALQDGGDRQAAIKVTLDALTPSIDKAADRVSIFTKTWESLTKAASDAVNAAGKAVAGQTTNQENLAGLLEARGRIESGYFNVGKSGRLRIIDEQIEKTKSLIKIEEEAAGFRAKAAQTARDSLAAGEVIRGIETDLERVKELRAELEKLQKVNSDAGRGAVGNGAGQDRANEALQNAIASSLTNQQKLRAETDLTVRSVMARTLEEQKSVAAERTRIELAGQKLTTLERELQIQRSILEVQAQAAREARDANRAANDNAATAGLRPYEAAMARNRIDIRELRVRTEGGGAAAAGVDPSFAAKVRALIEAVGDPGARMTSGFRTREKQQELYDQYGPGRAARPGSSQHEHGTAMDYVFSSPAARARAMELAQQQGIRALPSNGGAVHFDAGKGGISDATIQTYNRGTQAAKDYATQQEFVTVKMRDQRDALKNQNEQLTVSEQTFQRSAYTMGRAAKEQELLNGFFRDGVRVTPEMRKEIDALADAYGRTAERAASVKLRQDAIFERQQLLRTDTERAVASRLNGTGIGMDSEVANQLRFNSELERSIGLAGDFTNTMFQGAVQGKKGIDVLRDAVMGLASQLASMASQQLVRGLFSGLFGGGATSGASNSGDFISAITSGAKFLIPSANGNAFSGGNVIPFASGGVLSSPAMFPLAGGRRGIAGEAGPEGILPLKRGRNGALGVIASGASASTSIVMGGTTITVQGNADDKTLAAMRAELDARDRQFASNVQKSIAEMQRRGAA
jgi:phage-related minor tail protein